MKYYLELSRPFLIIIGVLTFFGGFVLDNELGGGEGIVLGVLVAAMFTLLFWITRKNFVVISSPSMKIEINVKGMKREKILDFINTVELTKHKRILSLNNKPDFGN
jgi:hypothetical protein